MAVYPERESNPHGHRCPRDFKSRVSTYSTIRAFPVKPCKYSKYSMKTEGGGRSRCASYAAVRPERSDSGEKTGRGRLPSVRSSPSGRAKAVIFRCSAFRVPADKAYLYRSLDARFHAVPHPLPNVELYVNRFAHESFSTTLQAECGYSRGQ